ncbi:SDR family NAD(P)-dependent oxidoreductase [Massilia niabensis]|uniref:SDR family NAD(P)-dependent oxidoreductase n=1 Tax=Massilia niabensis TaxID=544910 RepID=A0ABW0LCK8_9BURK
MLPASPVWRNFPAIPPPNLRSEVWTKAASIDLASDNIRVNSVHPGMIDTPMNVGATSAPKLQAIKRMGLPREVAAMVLFLASDDASFCTGSEYVVDGGYLNVVGEVLI